MKTIFLLALVALAAANDALNKLEKIDMAALDADVGEFKKLVDCFVDKGPCTELYGKYKVLIPEVLKESCRECSVDLKQLGNKFFETLKAKFPEDYVLFKQIHDPENKYLEAMEMEMKKYKTV